MSIDADVRGKPKKAQPPPQVEAPDWDTITTAKMRMMSLNLALTLTGGMKLAFTVDNSTSFRAMEEREEQELVELLLLDL